MRAAQIIIIVLTVLYVVGIIGLSLPMFPEFVKLTPANLILSFVLVMYFHEPQSLRLWGFVLLCFAVGFGVEVLGVNYGLLFGDYAYGPVLGFQIADTPFLIGINWVLLVYSSGVTVNFLFHRLSRILKALLGATFMVALDYWIEPVAVQLNFWYWEEMEIPLQNYAAWWGVGLLLHLAFQELLPGADNKVGVVLFFLQWLFFVTLTFTL